MAISLQTLRGQRKTSIYGRRLGLAAGNVTGEEWLQGMTGVKQPVTELTSGSTSQTLVQGFTAINVTSAVTTGTNTFLLPLPVPGARVTYSQGVAGTTSTQGSTAIALIRPSTAFVIESSEGTTNTTVLLPFGTAVELMGMSTARYKVSGRSGLLTVNGTT
jgi:hypothetical protein